MHENTTGSRWVILGILTALFFYVGTIGVLMERGCVQPVTSKGEPHTFTHSQMFPPQTQCVYSYRDGSEIAVATPLRPAEWVFLVLFTFVPAGVGMILSRRKAVKEKAGTPRHMRPWWNPTR